MNYCRHILSLIAILPCACSSPRSNAQRIREIQFSVQQLSEGVTFAAMFNVLGITIEPDSKLIPADTKNSGFDVIGLSKSPKIRVEIHNEKNVVYTLANGNIIRDPQTRAVIEFSYGEIESAAYLFPPGTDFITLTAYGFRNSQREVIKICIVE